MAQCGQNKDYASIDVLRRLKYTGKPDYELPSLVSDYWPDKLPVFIRVTCGYCGANAIDFTFASDEVYMLILLLSFPRGVLCFKRVHLFICLSVCVYSKS